MNWGEIFGAIQDRLPGYAFWILAAGFIGYWYTGLIFKRKDGNPLPGFLRGGGMARFYRRPLKRALDVFDRLLAPPEYLDRTDPRYRHACSCAREWNWRGYDRMLLLAVAYPILLPIIVWVFTGAAAELGAVTLIPQSYEWGYQVLTGVALLGVALALGFNRMLARYMHRATLGRLLRLWNGWYPERKAPPELGLGLVRAVLIYYTATGAGIGFGIYLHLAFTILVIDPLAYANSIALGLGDEFALEYVYEEEGAGAVAFAVVVVVAVVVTVAGAFAFAGAVAVVIAFASAFVGGYVYVFVSSGGLKGEAAWEDLVGARAFLNAGVHELPVVVVVAAALAWAVYRRCFPALAYALLTLVVIRAIGGVARSLPEIPEEQVSLIVFLGLFPVLNAVFDHASLGLTRWSLRMSLAPARGRWGGFRVPFFWVLDAVGALALLGGLILTMLGSVALLNDIAPAPLVDLRDAFADMRDGGMAWLYLVVFSTLIPTLAHFALFVVGLWFRYPGAPLRHLLATYAEKGSDGDDRRFLVKLAMGGWAALLAALIILPVVHILPNAADWHGDAITWLIDRLEAFADARGWLGPPP